MEERRIIDRFPAGIITPPPSKSLCHRAILCAALAAREGGESIIQNPGRSEDISATLRAARSLGVTDRMDGDRALHIGPGSGERGGAIDCGESGSTLRFLLPIAALEDRETIFTMRGRLPDRPLAAYAELFAQAGVAFSQNGREVRVRGVLRGGRYALPGDVSSQFVSGMLLALPLAERDSELRLTGPLQSRQYVELTLDTMKRFGVEVAWPDRSRFLIGGGQRYRPARCTIEADYSQAAYFLAAAALGRDVRCRGLHPESRQGDRAVLRILGEMGAEVRREGDTVAVRAGRLRAVTVDARETPDLIPPIAALCCFCEGTSHIVNAGRLRFKESDRLHSLSQGLGALGASIAEGEDSLTVVGAPSLVGGRTDAWGDHRVAMAIAVAAIRCREPVELSGWRSVDKSYPDFWNDFNMEQ